MDRHPYGGIVSVIYSRDRSRAYNSDTFWSIARMLKVKEDDFGNMVTHNIQIMRHNSLFGFNLICFYEKTSNPYTRDKLVTMVHGFRIDMKDKEDFLSWLGVCECQ